MSEVTPSEIGMWQTAERGIRSVFSSYGYKEIRLPLVERTELFSRGVGKSTDIVSKEMYTFQDRGGEAIALRPEGTASCVRACLENDLLRVDSPRLWYMGPMFRYERPQKGRSRQFHQASLEVYGIEDPLENITIAGEGVEANDWLAAFTSDGETVVAEPVQVEAWEGLSPGWLTLYGGSNCNLLETGDIPVFKIYDASENLYLNTEVTYNGDFDGSLPAWSASEHYWSNSILVARTSSFGWPPFAGSLPMLSKRGLAGP